MGPRDRLNLRRSMRCEYVQKSISSYLDNWLAEPERRSVALHLAGCLECAALHGRTAQVRDSLRELPVALAPKRLVTDLRVLASKELVRRRHMGSLSARIEFWMEDLRLMVDNLMRPLALPFAGGLVSAMFSFAMLMPNLGFLRTAANDRPSPLYTEASVENVADF